MTPFLPKRLEPMAFGFLLSGMMSFIVSGLSTFLAIGTAGDFMSSWMHAWFPSWAIAFPTVLVVAPLVRRVLSRIVKAQ
jgi:hypothetical protein